MALTKQKLFFYILYLCFIYIASGFNQSSAQPQSQPYADFIQSVYGNWKGCAVTTPIGPRPYDIHFIKKTSGHIEGVADPGEASDHYWSYQLEEGVLWLKFLSTFRGNEDPTWLSAVERRNNTIVFRSKRVRKLKVEVKLLDNKQNIEIFLYEKPHVSIRLEKSSGDDQSRSVCKE